MASRTSIEWTRGEDGSPGYTWNPIRFHAEQDADRAGHFCLKISEGCANCYASRMQGRFGNPPFAALGPATVAEARRAVEEGRIFLDHGSAGELQARKVPTRVFVCSMTDLFGEWVPYAWQEEVLDQCALLTRHTFQLLTKRPAVMERAIRHWTVAGVRPLPPNIWLGTSIELPSLAHRMSPLLALKADERARTIFLSVEPLLGDVAPALEELLGPPASVTLHPQAAGGAAWTAEQGQAFAAMGRAVIRKYAPSRLDWIIGGGESGGPEVRRIVQRCQPCRPAGRPDPSCAFCHGTGWEPKVRGLRWARGLRDFATARAIPFTWKQWGGTTAHAGGRLLDGRTWDEAPETQAEVTA